MPVFAYVIIHINLQTIIVYRNFFGLKSKRIFSNSKKNIDLRYIPTYRIRKKGKRSREVASHIVIKQGENKYQLISSGNSLFSPIYYEPEVEWIAYEISEWLGIPLTQMRFD